MDALTYPASEQGGLLWSWWAWGHTLVPACVSRRHAAARTEVLSGGRGREGNNFYFSLCSTPLIAPKQRALKLSLTKSPWQVTAPQTCSLSLPPASGLRHWVQIPATEVLLRYEWGSIANFWAGVSRMPSTPWTLPGGETWTCRDPSFPAFGDRDGPWTATEVEKSCVSPHICFC